jgi:hypothetical protein
MHRTLRQRKSNLHDRQPLLRLENAKIKLQIHKKHEKGNVFQMLYATRVQPIRQKRAEIKEISDAEEVQ